MMKKMIMLVMLFVSMTGVAMASAAHGAAGPRIAVVPYLDTSEQDKDYVGGMLDKGYTDYFAALPGAVVVPKADVQAALQAAGYDKTDMALPEKTVMAAVAKATRADYVVAMELSNLSAIRHESFFQYKITVNVKLEYHFYNTKKNTMLPFKTTGSSDNAAILGDVGFKVPIEAALNQAMKKANDKMVGAMTAR